MTFARREFLTNLQHIQDALAIKELSQGATSTDEPGSILILRRGILVSSLVALESFVRDRTTELLSRLGDWPAQFQDLPRKLRQAAILDGLSNLHKFALMQYRNKNDFEEDLKSEIIKMATFNVKPIGFTRFISGDQTGNISVSGLKSLLGTFQIQDVWRDFQKLSGDIGFGVPSVEELVKGLVLNRHRSAHSSRFAPTIQDTNSLVMDLYCIGICFDASLTASVEIAVADGGMWSRGPCDWRSNIDLYTIDKVGQKHRLKQFGRQRPIRSLSEFDDYPQFISRLPPGRIALVVARDASRRPHGWEILVA